jgi:hypothetical protein
MLKCKSIKLLLVLGAAFGVATAAVERAQARWGGWESFGRLILEAPNCVSRGANCSGQGIRSAPDNTSVRGFLARCDPTGCGAPSGGKCALTRSQGNYKVTAHHRHGHFSWSARFRSP